MDLSRRRLFGLGAAAAVGAALPMPAKPAPLRVRLPLMSIIGDLVMLAADFPMADEAAERLRRMVPAVVTSTT